MAGARARSPGPRPVHVETTVATRDDAASMAAKVLRARLAACVLTAQVSSRYWWKGKLEEANEMLVVFKTTSARAAKLAARILQLHPYEVPYLRVERMDRVPAAYRTWLAKETAPRRPRVRRASR